MALEPFRLRVKKAVCETVKSVTVANGFHFDLADVEVTENGETRVKESVFRGRELFGDTDPLPMVSLLEHPGALDALVAPDASADQIGGWRLLIQGFAKDDKDHPTDPADYLAADVMAALGAEFQRTLPGFESKGINLFGLGHQQPCVTGMVIGSPIVRPADGVNSSQAFFWLTLTLTLSEDLSNPYG